MIPNLLSEEPPALTSAKEPWVSDKVTACKAGHRVLSARQWVAGIRDDWCLLPLPKQLDHFYFQKFLEFLVPRGLLLRHTICTNVHGGPPVSPALG